MTFEEWFKKYIPPSLWGSKKLFEKAWIEGMKEGWGAGYDEGFQNGMDTRVDTR